MNSESEKRTSQPVTLEAVLRFKRLEKPTPEFWTHFERELRAKQLAAIVAKRPWWSPFARSFGFLSRHQLLVGAAAALAVSWAGFHEYRTFVGGHERLVSDGESAYVLSQTPAAETTAPRVLMRAAQISETDRPEEIASSSRGNSAAEVPIVMPSTLTAGTIELSQSSGFEQQETPSELSIAANLAVAQASEPEMIRNFAGLSRNFESALVPEHTPVRDPLSQMISPSEERRARLLADVLPVSASSAERPLLSNERSVSQLSDDRLYNSISRYRVAGSELSIRF